MIEIDTYVRDTVIAYLEKYIAHADQILSNQATLSKRQLLRHVEHSRANAAKGLYDIKTLYNTTEAEE